MDTFLAETRKVSSLVAMEEDSAKLPLAVMRFSTRAYNCLYRSGCRCAGDVARLEAEKIRQIRSMGTVTCAEIARVLEGLGITGTDWSNYL